MVPSEVSYSTPLAHQGTGKSTDYQERLLSYTFRFTSVWVIWGALTGGLVF